MIENNIFQNIKKDKYERVLSSINRINGKELSNLVAPCYYPKTQLYKFSILNELGIKEDEIKKFRNSFLSGSKGEKWNIINDDYTFLILILMRLSFVYRKRKDFETLILFMLIRNYANLIRKHIAFCNKDYFRMALENLIKTHLFSREGSIPGGILFLSKVLSEKHFKDFEDLLPNSIIDFVMALRHRISQSVKSFSGNYYKFHAEGKKMSIQREPEEDSETNLYQYKTMQRGMKVIENVSSQICVYKTVNNDLLQMAREMTKGIESSVCTLLYSKLRDMKYTENVKIILKTFLDNVTDISTFCDVEKLKKLIRNLLSIRKESRTIYFKQQIGILLMNLLEDLKMKKDYENFRDDKKYIYNFFLASLITLHVSKYLCVKIS